MTRNGSENTFKSSRTQMKMPFGASKAQMLQDYNRNPSKT